jgi:hypothetical protein
MKSPHSPLTPGCHVGAAPIPPVDVVEVEAPLAADVTITATTDQVFRVYQPGALLSIACTNGAGSVAGTDLFVSLQDGTRFFSISLSTKCECKSSTWTTAGAPR